MEGLYGEHPFAMGEGGRVCVGILEKLGGGIVAFLSGNEADLHIELWPADGFEQEARKCRKRGGKPPERTLRVAALPSGALVLPEKMLEAAGMPAGVECKALGNHDHVELWNAQSLESYLDQGIDLSLLF